MKYLWLAILLLFCTTANAEEYAAIKNFNLDRKLSLSLKDYQAFNSPIFDDSIVDHVTFGGWIPGTLKIEYIGIHGIVLGQAEKRMKQAAKRRIRRRYHHGNISDADTNAAFASLNGSNNPYGDWWDRQWFHSLPASKGGAPSTQETMYIGHDIKIPNDWGIITYLRDKFENIGDVWIRNDHLYDEEENDSTTAPGETREETKKRYDINDFNSVEYRSTSILVDGKEIAYEWFRGSFYHFRFKPSLRIKGGLEPADFIDELSLKFVCELFTNNNYTHFANISLFTRYNIPDNELFASIVIEILTW